MDSWWSVNKANLNDKFQSISDAIVNLFSLALDEETFSSEEKCYDWFNDKGATKQKQTIAITSQI